MNVAVEVAGIVPVRLDLAHVGTAEQQLGMSLGTVLVYLRRAGTARTIADGWSRAAVQARSLSPAIAGRRQVITSASTVAVIVQMAGLPQMTAEFEPARYDGAVPAMLRIRVGPVTSQVRDATAYTSMLRAWRQAARLLRREPDRAPPVGRRRHRAGGAASAYLAVLWQRAEAAPLE